ncbi:LacI family DNA-binding transcriptional regulator [Yoonia sp. MH D7]
MKKHRQQITILDVARLSGLSKSTVSRALSGATNISQDAQDKVAQVVAETGYRPNDIARSLRSGRTGIVGLLIPDIANPFWADVARGAQDAAAEVGISVLIFSSDWDPAREKQHLQALVQARVDGAIVNPVRDGLSEIAHFDLPTVLIGSSASRFPALTSVSSDIDQGVAIALDRIAASGLGVPAFLVGDEERSARARFLKAVQAWADLAGVVCDDLVLANGKYSVDGGRIATEALLDGGAVPRAIFAANDLMALGAMQALRNRGISCPDTVAVLGFDGIAAGEVTTPALTTVEKPSRQIGEESFRLLIKAIKGEQGAHVTLPCRLRERGTLPDLAQPRRPALVG